MGPFAIYSLQLFVAPRQIPSFFTGFFYSLPFRGLHPYFPPRDNLLFGSLVASPPIRLALPRIDLGLSFFLTGLPFVDFHPSIPPSDNLLFGYLVVFFLYGER